MNCATCHFASERFNYDNYRCHRHAPAVMTVESHTDLRQHIPIWPVMVGDDWCGDYEAAGLKAGE